jgi:hypothetical protein
MQLASISSIGNSHGVGGGTHPPMVSRLLHLALSLHLSTSHSDCSVAPRTTIYIYSMSSPSLISTPVYGGITTQRKKVAPGLLRTLELVYNSPRHKIFNMESLTSFHSLPYTFTHVPPRHALRHLLSITSAGCPSSRSMSQWSPFCSASSPTQTKVDTSCLCRKSLITLCYQRWNHAMFPSGR